MHVAPRPVGAADGRALTAPAQMPYRLRRDDGWVQFLRFVAVGGAANVLYALVFVSLADVGSQLANLTGSIASSVLANELHRQLTFRAGGRVSWLRAQWEGGGLALAGMVATAAALQWYAVLAPGSGAAAQLVVVAVVTGAVGVVRFAVLRWVFGAAAGDDATGVPRPFRGRRQAVGRARPRHLAPCS